MEFQIIVNSPRQQNKTKNKQYNSKTGGGLKKKKGNYLI